jgi:hypothetical protein
VRPSVDKPPAGRISVVDRPTGDASSLSPEAVLAKIQSAYMAGLKRCYREYLEVDASARGKVSLSLTVNEAGRAVKGVASNRSGRGTGACTSPPQVLGRGDLDPARAVGGSPRSGMRLHSPRRRSAIAAVRGKAGRCEVPSSDA